MSQPPGRYVSHYTSSGRPATIPELAERALDNLWDDKANLKHYLRIAEKYRKDGKELARQGDIESAFVLLAKAATLVLEKLPTHRDYHSLLNAEQQNNLALNGQDILDHLGELKKALLDRYDEWQRRYPDGPPPDHELTPNGRLHTTLDDRDDPSPRSQVDLNIRLREEEEAHLRAQQRAAEEANMWRIQREAAERLDAEVRNMKKDAATAAARQAAAQPLVGAGSFNAAQQQRTQQQHEDLVRRQQEDMLRRQQAADDQARMIRQNIPSPSVPPPASAPPTGSFYQPYPSLSQQSYQEAPLMMPLENPSGYEGDSTDSESVHLDFHRRRQRQQQQQQQQQRAPLHYPTSAPPVTTTSAPIGYPQLMSPHQQRQGYYPSTAQPPQPSFTSRGGEGLYSQNHLPAPSAPVQYHQPPPPPPILMQQPQQPHARPYPPVPRPAPPVPSTNDATRTHSHPHTHEESAPRRSDDGTPVLKSVSLPKECLPRFIAIAKVNTANNKETCGLLLGKDKGHKYVVTTLLIPKQHATSDTCTMEEEELVLQFTEERSLITLGWIHTHPSQSCFMSSVDLHTHSGFQRMLPESFAVVCAPNSTPNFGIFRLTNPPGLDVILNCKAKDAFHPHPDLPIYTDADKGHVIMKSGNLEIVDLR